MMRETYLEIVNFLDQQYGFVSSWLCRRVLMSLDKNQVIIERKNGKITTYVGWWLIDRADLEKVMAKKFTPADVSKGNMIYVMDAASIDRQGILSARRILRSRYPAETGIQGIAWLRDAERPVVSLRQKGVS